MGFVNFNAGKCFHSILNRVQNWPGTKKKDGWISTVTWIFYGTWMSQLQLQNVNLSTFRICVLYYMYIAMIFILRESCMEVTVLTINLHSIIYAPKAMLFSTITADCYRKQYTSFLIIREYHPGHSV